MLVNSTVQTFFMANADEFSELIRTGSLDFALLKPIDTQFLVSLQRVEWSSLGNFCFGLVLATYALIELRYLPTVMQGLLYLGYVAAGVVILYSLMISLAASSIWLGRNQTLYDFWFYITNFARYPREIYRGPVGDPLRWFFTFFIPILVVINVPARILVPAKQPQTPEDWCLPLSALVAAVAGFLTSRWVFRLCCQVIAARAVKSLKSSHHRTGVQSKGKTTSDSEAWFDIKVSACENELIRFPQGVTINCRVSGLRKSLQRRSRTMASELTKRHREVVRLLSLGCTVNESAKILGLSPSTVDNHKTAAMARLGTDKLALVTRLALKLRITSMKDQLTPREKRLSGRRDDGWN